MLRRPTTTTFAVEPTGFAREHGSEHEYRVTRGDVTQPNSSTTWTPPASPWSSPNPAMRPSTEDVEVVCQQQSCLPRH